MKNYYKIHIMYPAPLFEDTIKEIDNCLLPSMRGRIKVDEKNNQIGSIILSVDSLGNPEYDELSQFLLDLDGIDCIPFFGYPNEDFSNAVTDESDKSVWGLLDNCEVDELTL